MVRRAAGVLPFVLLVSWFAGGCNHWPAASEHRSFPLSRTWFADAGLSEQPAPFNYLLLGAGAAFDLAILPATAAWDAAAASASDARRVQVAGATLASGSPRGPGPQGVGLGK